MTTPKPQPAQSKPPSWIHLFDWIEFTPEEERLLDEVWASPEMEKAVNAAGEKAVQDAQAEEDDEARTK